MHRERLINRRQQGDLGEASAIEWLTRQGARVSVPLGFSPDYDLIAELEGRLLRVQVKTSTGRQRTPQGVERWSVHIATNGGNQSWTGVTKRFDAARVDLLFVLVGDGRRWLLPANEIEGATNIRLGGDKYSEFEIGADAPIEGLVYGTETGTRIGSPQGERRSRRAGPVCKIGASALSEFDSHLPHSTPSLNPPAVGRTRISANRQVTVPKAAFEAARLRVGDLMRAEARADGAVVMTPIRTVAVPAPAQRELLGDLPEP
jgi:bifunctional DNA-binding transcriptional regulator/antitoxin component of YhaV-PrlF toxin-antitoxin module/Holliday junction resolvase-like predicted endonuclease